MMMFLLLAACGYNARYELTYTGDLRGALAMREMGVTWSSLQITSAEQVDFSALARGLEDPPGSWSGGEGPDDGSEVVTVEAWIDTEDALAAGCPDLLDFDACRPGPNDPMASVSREVGPVSFNIWRLVLEDPE